MIPHKAFSSLFFFVFLTIGLGMLAPVSASGLVAKKDSVGMTKIDGKLHIRYMVSPGETIYRISSKFKVAVTELLDINPELENGLKTGQIISIPFKNVPAPTTATKIIPQYKESTPTESELKKEATPKELTKKETIQKPVTSSEPTETKVSTPASKDTTIYGVSYHTIEPGETFYSLSRKYQISVNDLLKLNQVDLKTGLKIIVKQSPDAQRDLAPKSDLDPKKNIQLPPAPNLNASQAEPLDQNTQTKEVAIAPLESNTTAAEQNSEIMQMYPANTSGLKRLLVIPFDPYLYFSDADDEIAAGSRMSRTKVRQSFRRRLSSLLDPNGYETLHLLGGQARDSITDLNRIYSGVSYGYQDILHNPMNWHQETVTDQGNVKKKDNSGQKKPKENSNSTGPEQTNSRSIQATDPNKYFGVKINDPAFLTYFNTKYQIDYYLFVTQFEVKTNYENCLDRATQNYERGFVTHFSILDQKGQLVAGSRVYMPYNSNSNNIERILADNIQKVADKIMAELPKP